MKRHHYKPSPSIRHLIKKVVIMMSTRFNNYAHAQAVVTRRSTLTPGYEASIPLASVAVALSPKSTVVLLPGSTLTH